MPNITESTNIPISKLLGDLEPYKYNPSMIQRVILDHLENITNGAVDIIDPTNPFVFLLEASAVNTASAIIESVGNLRKQYPALAQTEDELYRHMSDKDFVNRFATPSKASFTFMIQYVNLLSLMEDDPALACRKCTIARNTEFEINGLKFSLQYPIDLKQYYNGAFQISYDATLSSPIQPLTTNIIDHFIAKDGTNLEWLYFKVDAHQFYIETAYQPIQASSTFSLDVNYKDQYYYCRVYYKNNASGNNWVEIKTTHTDQVYDPFNPTAVLKVMTGVVNIYIPQVYVNQQLIDGNIRVDVYQTKGFINVNMNNYILTAFTTNLKAIDGVNDINKYTNAFTDSVYLAYTDEIVIGGSNGLSFDKLREMVIDNAIGDFKLPITTVQLDSKEYINGFRLIKNVDIVTNRIYLATRKLPTPSNPKLITPANLTVGKFITNLDQLSLFDNTRKNNNKITLLSNCLFKSVDEVLSIYSTAQLQALLNLSPYTLAESVNASKYLYNPFYTVFDNSLNEFEVRIYHLDAPVASDLNFISHNNTTELTVNTVSYVLEKNILGFRLRVLVKSDEFYKALDDKYLSVQLAFIPDGETQYAYTNGYVISMVGDERLYEFNIITNYDIDNNDLISITNFKMFNTTDIITQCPLTATFNILYTTNSITPNYKPNTSSDLIGKFMLPLNSVVVTHEKLTLKFGVPLKQLWAQTRSVAAGANYATYIDDIPLLYDDDVYAVDPITNSIFTITEDNTLYYKILHKKGDPVLTDDGYQVYKHKKGDVMMDEYGHPIIAEDVYALRHLDMLFVEGGYFFTTDPYYIEYRKEIADTIVDWVTDSLAESNDMLLEQTKIYYYPQKTMGMVSVYINKEDIVTIDASQNFYVELYVNERVYKDPLIRTELEATTVKIFNDIISENTVSISNIIVILKDSYKSLVVAVKVYGLGGDGNYETVTLVDQQNQLSVRKKLYVQDDGSLIVKEDISIKFIEYMG